LKSDSFLKVSRAGHSGTKQRSFAVPLECGVPHGPAFSLPVPVSYHLNRSFLSVHMSSIRLALLLCDTPLPSVVASNGDYYAIFSKLLEKSAPEGVKYTLSPYDVVHKMEYPDEADRFDGFILTGSGVHVSHCSLIHVLTGRHTAASAYENVEWINRLVAYVADLAKSKPKVKIFGICFGHQIIARALGGECVPNGGKWEVGTTPVEMTEVGRRIFGTDILVRLHLPLSFCISDDECFPHRIYTRCTATMSPKSPSHSCH
jgi:GMP synthase-like glutamine amidotransferase